MNVGTVNPADITCPRKVLVELTTAELKQSRFCILYKIVSPGMDPELPSLDVFMHVSAFVLNNASFTAKYKESAGATCRKKSAVNSDGSHCQVKLSRRLVQL